MESKPFNENLSGLNNKLKKIIEIKGFSQEYVASKLNINQNTYSRLERGENSISVDKLNDICNALEFDLNTLLNFDEKQVFNNCNQTGNFGENNTFVLNTIEKLQEIYEKVIKSKDEEIVFLRKLLNEKSRK